MLSADWMGFSGKSNSFHGGEERKKENEKTQNLWGMGSVKKTSNPMYDETRDLCYFSTNP